jgi:hypothetical protein
LSSRSAFSIKAAARSSLCQWLAGAVKTSDRCAIARSSAVSSTTAGGIIAAKRLLDSAVFAEAGINRRKHP